MYDRGPGEAVAEFIRSCLEDTSTGKCVSARDAHGLVYAQEHPEFHEILENFYWNLPDGMPCVWIGRMKGASKMRRCYGPDFFADVMRQTNETPISHFLCGGHEGVADLLKASCAERFSNTNIVGTYYPPFRDMNESELRELSNQINEARADIVWVGISTPRQERLALNLSKYVNSRFLVSVGAAFDFHTDRVRQAPVFLQKIGMEWFFRLCMEPRRLFRRYLGVVPKFVYFNILELAHKKAS